MKFVACYGKAFQTAEVPQSQNAYVFDISNSSQPEFTLYSQIQINAIQFSQKDYRLLFAGLESGVVAMYDTRRSNYPIAVSDI